MFAFGAIVLARFPFTDLSGDKRRPALVVSRDNERRRDVVVCFIASVPQTGPETAILLATAETGLKVPSAVPPLGSAPRPAQAGIRTQGRTLWLPIKSSSPAP